MENYYNWLIVIHIISFTSWMAALFYLPRLFVYHRENYDNDNFVKVVEVQEEKLYKAIGLPSFISTLLTGICMVYINIGLIEAKWLYVKFVLVILLAIYFFTLGYYKNILKQNKTYKSGKFFRIYNEVPIVILIGISIMVVIKPF